MHKMETVIDLNIFQVKTFKDECDDVYSSITPIFKR